MAPAKTLDTFLPPRTEKGASASERHKPQRTEPFLAGGKNAVIYLGTETAFSHGQGARPLFCLFDI